MVAAIARVGLCFQIPDIRYRVRRNEVKEDHESDIKQGDLPDGESCGGGHSSGKDLVTSSPHVPFSVSQLMKASFQRFKTEKDPFFSEQVFSFAVGVGRFELPTS